MTRVADFAFQQFTNASIASIQQRMAKANLQITTGKNAQLFKDIAADTNRLLSLETQHARASQYLKNVELVSGRLDVMEANLSQLMDIASKFQSQLSQAISGASGGQTNLDAEAQVLLDQVASLLNVERNGRYLFAGARTDTVPVDLTDPDFTTPTVPSTADTDYYQGDGTTLSVQADVSNSIDYGVTADDPAIEKLIRSLHLAATGSSSDVPRLEEALSVVEQAIDEIPSVITRIGTAQRAIDSAIKAHDDALLYTEEAIATIENVDLTKAITQVSQDQSTLEASFAALAQVSRVSLLDFL